MTPTWIKVLEYASKPLHGTMSRKLRKGVRLQINNEIVYENAVIFIGDKFIRLTQNDTPEGNINAYYDLNHITAMTTYSKPE